MKEIKITYEELQDRYRRYCKGEYPEYRKEHNTWVIKE